MRVTTKGRYALRALTNLAASGNERPKSIKTISAEEEISAEFLEQIFFKLKKAGIINSVRGPGGGFVLNGKPDDISVRSILEAVEEGLDITPCASCGSSKPEVCQRMDSCSTHQFWQEAAAHIQGFFENARLSSLVDRKPAGQ